MARRKSITARSLHTAPLHPKLTKALKARRVMVSARELSTTPEAFAADVLTEFSQLAMLLMMPRFKAATRIIGASPGVFAVNIILNTIEGLEKANLPKHRPGRPHPTMLVDFFPGHSGRAVYCEELTVDEPQTRLLDRARRAARERKSAP